MGRSPTRRPTLGFAAVLAAAFGALLLLRADAQARDDSDSGESGTAYVDGRQRRGVDDALKWIHGAMNPGGKWGKTGGVNTTEVADTALCLLALMAGGNTLGPGVPDRDGHVGGPTLRGQYAADVRDGIDFLARLACKDRDSLTGYIEDGDSSRMHGHGFATLALATACAGLGASPIRDIRNALANGVTPATLPYADRVRLGLQYAVELIQRSQDRDTGGWYYTPFEGGHEGSMTVTEITALRAASEAGVNVSNIVIKNAYRYIRDSQNTTQKELHGGFAYKIDDLTNVSIALTAASLTTLFGLGRYGDRPEDRQIIDRGISYMERRWSEDAFDTHRQFFYYRVFYLAQAVYLSGEERLRRRYLPQIRDHLLDLQLKDGSFPHDRFEEDRSTEYCTAMACLTLQTPMETLPIFQRR